MMLKVLVIRPNEIPKVEWIENNLDSFQEVVGGYIECVYPFRDNVCLICNEEGKLNGSLPNRPLFDENGDVYDIIFGTFFIVRNDDLDLTDEQIGCYATYFRLR